jgi:opacity protein-like surface antigen
MSKRVFSLPILVCASACILLGGQRADAQVVTRVEPRQSFGFNLGYFSLRGEDSRAEEDVLLANLTDLLFEIDDFNSVPVGAEYLFGFGDFLEAGAGIGYQQRTVSSIYRDFTDIDNTEIEQDLKLRVVPMSATLRFLPIGRGGIEPYVGAGIGFFNWRYSEAGEFIDVDGLIFRDRFSDSGTAVGPVILGGVRFPVSDVFTVGGELRYQKAEGDIDADSGLLGEKIDLGGWTTSFTMHIRF